MFSYFEPNSLKKLLWKSVFQILIKIEMTQNKKRLFGRHFETVRHFYLFFPEIWFLIVHRATYCANFIAKFQWESGLLKGVPWNPLGTNGSKSTLVT